MGKLKGTVRLAASAEPWQAVGMTISPNPYRGFRFPSAVIEHAVWLYHCFSLSLRDVELIPSSATRASASGACASAGSSPMR